VDSTIFLSEVVGTALLMLLGCGVVANVVLKGTKGSGGGFLMINVGWALGVYCGVLTAYKSGGHLNPAVTLGLIAAGDPTAKAHLGTYLVAQMLGAMIGAGLAWLSYKDHLDAEPDPVSKLAVFSTFPAIRNPWMNLITEIIGTFVLVFVVLTFGKHGDAKGLASLGALPVALLILAIGASLGGPTGYAINPARDLGPRLMHAILPIQGKGSSDWSYAWVPIVGPILGGILAGLLAAPLLPV
jgi:glycerol uptake facilitator protein